MEKIISRNRMSVESLKSMSNDQLHIKENPKKAGSFFFTCGDTVGYISKPALNKIQSGCTANDLQYAECSIDGQPAVPCLMVVGNSQKNVRRELGSNLLH